MAQDISSIQRDLANLQKQSKQLSDKIKTETDPNRKAILQKKLIDLNVKKAELNKEIEAAVSSIGLGQELELEGFSKWNKYKNSKMKKLTEAEKLKVKSFAKGLVESKNPEFEKMIKDFITSISKKHGYGFNDALQSLAYYLKKMYPEAFNG